MSYLCKYCYQKFDSKKVMVLRNCSKSPTGKHSPAGPAIKGTYILGITVGIIFGLFELANYLEIPDKISKVLAFFGGKIDVMINFIKNIVQS